MTDRAIFNRIYTSFTPGSTPVWLVNGAGVTTTPVSTREFTAGEDLIQGQVVCLSGTYAVSASAASGVDAYLNNAVGITSVAASGASPVTVVLDDIAVVNDVNITAESSLTPGQYYYLSKYTGELTRFTTASGTVTASGGYGVLVNLGIALSTSEIHVEIQPPIDLYS